VVDKIICYENLIINMIWTEAYSMCKTGRWRSSELAFYGDPPV